MEGELCLLEWTNPTLGGSPQAGLPSSAICPIAPQQLTPWPLPGWTSKIESSQGSTLNTVQKFPLVWNIMTRFLSRTGRMDLLKQILCQFHWLQTCLWDYIKAQSLSFKALNGLELIF